MQCPINKTPCPSSHCSSQKPAQSLAHWLSEWMDIFPKFKFGVSKKVVDVYSLYDDIDPMVVERLSMCRKSQKCEKGENLSISTDELQASHVKLLNLELTLSGCNLQTWCLPSRDCCSVHLPKGIPKLVSSTSVTAQDFLVFLMTSFDYFSFGSFRGALWLSFSNSSDNIGFYPSFLSFLTFIFPLLVLSTPAIFFRCLLISPDSYHPDRHLRSTHRPLSAPVPPPPSFTTACLKKPHASECQKFCQMLWNLMNNINESSLLTSLSSLDFHASLSQVFLWLMAPFYKNNLQNLNNNIYRWLWFVKIYYKRQFGHFRCISIIVNSSLAK